MMKWYLEATTNYDTISIVRFVSRTRLRLQCGPGPIAELTRRALAQLHAAGFLPEVRHPTKRGSGCVRLVARRAGIIQGVTRIKNRVYTALHET